MKLIQFPPELIINIFLELELRSLLRCRQVCRLLRDIIDGDVRVQYKIELAAAGMEDGPPSTLTASERLRMLKTRQEAWDKLQWTGRGEMPMSQGGVWELYGGVLAQGESARTLAFKQLPSKIRGIEEREWRIEDVGVNIRDFGMDPAQDLLVIIENKEDRNGMTCAVHFKSIFTGEPHPAAPRPATVTHIPKRGRYSYTIQICADTVAILMTSGDEDHSELLMWSWKTGARRLHITGNDLSSFAFLTSRYVLLTSLPTMELDENNVFHGDDPRLFVIDLERMSARDAIDFSDIDYLCAFHYPALADSFATISISLRSDPAPNWRPAPALRVPFSVAREDSRLFVITLWVVEGNMHILPFISLVPAATFLAHVAEAEAEAADARARVFAWAEWGPRGSRFIPAPPTHTSVWVCYVYGSTFAMSVRQGAQRVVLTLDFNPLGVRRVQERQAAADAHALGQGMDIVDDAEHPADEGVIEASLGTQAGAGAGADVGGQQVHPHAALVTDERLFRPTKIFREEVRTALPYAVRKTPPFNVEGEGQFDAVMISEDSLVMVSSQSHIRKYRILSF
ncbi:hypothetical protein C2E23DRAFT_904719 [Lenzites betulinus]|nr:hypothetical protein C2E23DRAFT_904719 [Lenzites betulinus]